MKAYTQFLKELPSKKIVFAFGRFQPPTTGHELLVKAVEKLAKEQNAEHVIYASHSQDSSKNPLPVDRKVYYLQRMFPGAKFKAAGGTTRTFIEVAKELNKKYKDIIMVAGSDRVPEYKKILEKYNGKDFHFDTISVVSAGERDPDADNASGMSGTKMREAAKKGDFNLFKKGLPHTLTTVDGKRLMNEIREGMGLDAIKEQVKLATDWLRESYFRGEIYKVGQFVESNGQRFEILDRGSNYITVVDSNGNTHRKWITDVTLAEDYNVPHQDLPPTSFQASQISYKGYNTKHFDHDPDVFVAFHRTIQLPDVDPVAVLNAIKVTDLYLEILKQVMSTDEVTEQQHHAFDTYVQKAQEYLAKTGDLQHHVDYINSVIHMFNQVEAQYHKEKEEQMEESMKTFKDLMEMKFSSSDKIKVARIIADALGVADVEKNSSPEQLVNNALRKIRNKPVRPEYMAVLKNMLQTAQEAGIEYDKKLLPNKMDEGYDEVSTSDIKLDKRGRKVHARKLRFKNADKEDDLEESTTPYWKKQSWVKKMSNAAKQERLARERKEKEAQQKPVKEESELEESMTDSWKKVQSMDKGSLTGGKDQAKKRLDYLNAVHAHHKKYGNDTKKVKGEIERINRSRIAEEQIDEISQKLAGNYYGAATKKHVEKVGVKPNMYDRIEKDMGKQRKAGVDRALDRVTGARKTNEETEQIDELTNATLQSYKDKAKKSAEELAGKGEYKKSNDRLLNHMKATGKQIERTTKNISKALNKEEVKKDCECEDEGKPVVGDSGKMTYDAIKRFLGVQNVHKLEAGELKNPEEISPDPRQVGIPASPNPLRVKHHKMHEEAEDFSDMEEPKDEDFDEDLKNMSEPEHIIDAYDDEEFAIVDSDTGEELDTDGFEDDKEEEAKLQEGKVVILEISRMERIRRKQRFARTKSKREVRAQIALRKSSNSATISKRSRRLAISMIKKRMLRKDPSKATLAEKERIERFIQTRKAVVDRLARRVSPRIRQIEKARLQHKRFTK